MSNSIDQIEKEILDHLGDQSPVDTVGPVAVDHRHRLATVLNAIRGLEVALQDQVAYSTQLEDEICRLRAELCQSRFTGAA